MFVLVDMPHTIQALHELYALKAVVTKINAEGTSQLAVDMGSCDARATHLPPNDGSSA